MPQTATIPVVSQNTVDLKPALAAKEKVGKVAAELQTKGASVMDTVSQLEASARIEERRVMESVKQMSFKAVHELDEVRKAENEAQMAMNAVAEMEATAKAKIAAAVEAKKNAHRAAE